jgi:hypothetical protein
MTDRQVSLATVMLLFLFFALGWMLCDWSHSIRLLLESLVNNRFSPC